MDDQKWSELLGLVEVLGNVSLACERLEVSRSLYYKWRKLKSFKPMTGTVDSKSNRRLHPHSIPEQVKEKILSIARSNPEWGSHRISYFLELGGIRVSVATVHKLLIKSGLKKKKNVK